MIRKLYRERVPLRWKIIEKETIDEIIFRTTNVRNRLILELMARGGMRIGEVLKLRLGDLQDRKLVLQDPKTGLQIQASISAQFPNPPCLDNATSRIHIVLLEIKNLIFQPL